MTFPSPFVFGGSTMHSLFPYSRRLVCTTLAASLTVVTGMCPSIVLADPEGDPAAIGEQLFIETRFAESFKRFLTTNDMNINSLESPGDDSVSQAINWRRAINGEAPESNEFTSMNCSSCHLVDAHLETKDYGMRTYADFARRSPVPNRGDGKKVTVRNSPALVNASLERKGGLFLHFDGEFTSMQDLVEATLTGRNYGYLPTEGPGAIAHIAKVLRNDDGTLLDPEILGEKGNALTPSYRELLTGIYDGGAPADEFLLPEEFLVPVSYFDNPSAEHDNLLFQATAKLIAAYTEDLAFEHISPYDVFLEANELPKEPAPGQSDLHYSRHLLKEIHKKERYGNLIFVEVNPNTDNGKFQFHDQDFQFGQEQPFVFGPQELEGLKIFFTERRSYPNQHWGIQSYEGHDHEDYVHGPFSQSINLSTHKHRGIGNCIACHAAPNFTDFKFHNTGIAQAEYDSIHGKGSFKRLRIPGLYTRKHHHNSFLPATALHPNAQEPFRAIPSKDNKYLTDLGLWNIFANPDFPKAQEDITRQLCADRKQSHFFFWNSKWACHPKRLLPKTIGLFKTPGLRDLDHSAPFSHTGQANELEDVIQGYIDNSKLARTYKLRNGDRELRNIRLRHSDIQPIKAFMKSLNEDYE
jgi:hypothetical protein